MLDLALQSPGRTQSPQSVRIPRATRVVARTLGSAAIVLLCMLIQATGLAGVFARLDVSFPLRITPKTAVASVGLHRDGRIFVYFAPGLAQSTDGNMLAFLYLHEVGHARLGHLRPEDPQRMRFSIPGMFKGQAWQMEYDADAWAARRAVAYGYDPVRGIKAVFARNGDGGGITHPPDAVRIARVKALVETRR